VPLLKYFGYNTVFNAILFLQWYDFYCNITSNLISLSIICELLLKWNCCCNGCNTLVGSFKSHYYYIITKEKPGNGMRKRKILSKQKLFVIKASKIK